MKQLFALLFAFALTAEVAHATTYYVRKDGNDSCNGLVDQACSGGPGAPGAFLTIKHALEVQPLVGGDRVVVRHGVYYEQPLTMSQSGTPKNPVTGAPAIPITLEGFSETPDKPWYDKAVVVDVGVPNGHSVPNSDWTTFPNAAPGEYLSTFTIPMTANSFSDDRVYGFVLNPAVNKSYEGKYWPLISYVSPGESNCAPPTSTACSTGGNGNAWEFLESPTDRYVNSTTPFYAGPGVWAERTCNGVLDGTLCRDAVTHCGGAPNTCENNGRIRMRLQILDNVNCPTCNLDIQRYMVDTCNFFNSFAPDPTQLEVTLSRRAFNLKITARDVVVRNIQFHPAQHTIRLDGASNVLLENNTILAGEKAVIMGGSGIAPADNVTITNNKIIGGWAPFMFWTDAYCDPQPLECMKNTLIDMRNGTHDVTIDHNWLTGGFDSISTNNCEYKIHVHHNRIDRSGDDTFEIEAATGTSANCTGTPSIFVGALDAWENYIENPLVAFAVGQASETIKDDVTIYRNITYGGRDPAVNREVGIVDWNDGTDFGDEGDRYGNEYLIKTHKWTSAPTGLPRLFFYHNDFLLQNSHKDKGINVVPGNVRGKCSVTQTTSCDTDNNCPQGEFCNRTTADTRVFGNIYWKVNGAVEGSLCKASGGGCQAVVGGPANTDGTHLLDYNLYNHRNTIEPTPPQKLVDDYSSVGAACSGEEWECNGVGDVPEYGTDPGFASFNPAFNVDPTLSDYDTTDPKRWLLLPKHHAKTPADFRLAANSAAIDVCKPVPPEVSTPCQTLSNGKGGTLPDSRSSPHAPLDLGAIPSDAPDEWSGTFPFNMKWDKAAMCPSYDYGPPGPPTPPGVPPGDEDVCPPGDGGPGPGGIVVLQVCRK